MYTNYVQVCVHMCVYILLNMGKYNGKLVEHIKIIFKIPIFIFFIQRLKLL